MYVILFNLLKLFKCKTKMNKTELDLQLRISIFSSISKNLIKKNYIVINNFKKYGIKKVKKLILEY